MKNKVKWLCRYTTLEYLIDIIIREKMVLLDPIEHWEDKNDTIVIEEYKTKSKLNNLFALCFTYGSETIHHWKYFSGGSNGCCIKFNAEKLIKIFNKIDGIRHKKISYPKINELKPISFNLKQMPFIKRYPYKIENEYRVIWEGKSSDKVIEIDVPLGIIERITISGKMPSNVFKTIKNLIESKLDNPKIKIYRSTIYENKKWIGYFKKL